MHTTKKSDGASTKNARPKKSLNILVGGANRGTRQNLPGYERFNAKSSGTELVLRCVDPEPGRAAECAELAAKSGVAITPDEGRIEDAMRSDLSPTVLQVDNAETVANAMAVARALPRPVTGMLLVGLPGRLLGVRFTLTLGNPTAFQEVETLMHTLREVTAPSGSSKVIGLEAPIGQQLAEPLFREWFARHTEDVLGKFAAGTPVNCAPIEGTFDGGRTLPVLIVAVETFGHADDIVTRTMTNASFALALNEPVLVIEVARAALRVHEAWRNERDHRVVVESTVALDRALVERAAAESALRAEYERVAAERRAEEARDAARRAAEPAVPVVVTATEVATITRTNPVRVTD
jgi:hypothetical protein